MGEEGRFCGSVCGKEVFFFFFLFFTFFLCKKCTKAWQLLQRSAEFPGAGELGRAPGLAPSLRLKVASYCLETCVSV